MIYNISNKESEIEILLLKLRDIYGDYAFISYIDGEFGIRNHVYRSLVHTFYTTVKEQNITCIGIVFKNNKLFLDSLCDHIIEINDSYLDSIIENDENEDNSVTSQNHINCVVPSTYYLGSDGWNLSYIRGQHSKIYEDVLLKMNFNNIFYTLHGDGSRFINLYGVNCGCFFKINNVVAYYDNNNLPYLCKSNMIFSEKMKKYTKTNNIVIWVRNTNKWPERNMSKHQYTSVFDYCILNNKKCYVFQDIIHIDIPKHQNIIEMNVSDKIKNMPNLDNFMKICNESDIYIGANSGITEIVVSSKIDILVISVGEIEIKCNNCLKNINTSEAIINTLNNYYNV